MMKYATGFWFLFLLMALSSCETEIPTKNNVVSTPDSPYVTVLGIAQDAGYPQADCRKSCCLRTHDDSSLRRMVSCIAAVLPQSSTRIIFDATPDFPDQLRLLETLTKIDEPLVEHIFLTHAHIGHYTGLMHLGREVIGATDVPVYAMPRMKSFIETQGPWSQLVQLNNIQLRALKQDSVVRIDDISVTPIQVPHRDEFSETVGYLLSAKNQLLFIPDINKWTSWNQSITDWISKVDYALLDGSFYQNGEIPNRDMSEIPHPFIEESMHQFKNLTASDKKKVHFIHFNHTNPVLQLDSPAYQQIVKAGFNVAKQGQIFEL